MRKDILERRHKRLLEKRAELEKKSEASESVEEVRSINAQLKELNADIADVADEIAALDAEEKRSAEPAPITPPANAQLHNGNIVGAFTQATQASQKRENTNPLESMEYRSAFKAYVQNGAPIPAEFRAGEAISTEDTGAAIPLAVSL